MCLKISNWFCVHCYWGCGEGFGGRSSAFTENESWLDKVGAMSSSFSISSVFSFPRNMDMEWLHFQKSLWNPFSKIYKKKNVFRPLLRGRKAIKQRNFSVFTKTLFSGCSSGRHLSVSWLSHASIYLWIKISKLGKLGVRLFITLVRKVKHISLAFHICKHIITLSNIRQCNLSVFFITLMLQMV